MKRSAAQCVRFLALGFSLVEMLIAMAIGLLLISGVLALFSSLHRADAFQSALARLQENGRIALLTVSADLRQAGRLPCGAQYIPSVSSGDVQAHVRAALPSGPTFDRAIFLSGHECAGQTCVPALIDAEGLPPAGTNASQRVAGSDALVVRYLRDAGWSVNSGGAKQTCDADGKLVSIALPATAAGEDLKTFTSQHLGLLANCTAGEIFAVDVSGKTFIPYPGAAPKARSPTCMSGPETRLYDLDTQLTTVIYFLQIGDDDNLPGRKVSTLVRKIDGVTNEVVQGVERFDLRYSLTDAGGLLHWLDAAEIDRGGTGGGVGFACAKGAVSPHTCSWSDVDAVEVSMLIDSVDDVPADASVATWKYRYSIDGEDELAPASTMPITGLRAERMLRREFRTVIALSDFTP